MLISKRKIKIVVVENGRKIPIPSISLTLTLKICKILSKYLKRHIKNKNSKYLDLIKELHDNDIKKLINSLPKESFNFIDIKSKDGSVIFIRII